MMMMEMFMSLLGLLSLFGSLLSSTLGTNTGILGIGLSFPESGIGGESLLGIGNLPDFNQSVLGVGDGEGIGDAGHNLGSIEISNGSIGLLGMFGIAWQNNQFGLVGLQSFNIDLQRFGGTVTTTMIDANTDSTRQLAANTSLLEFEQREATTSAHLHIVLEGGTVHDWTK